MSPMAVSIEADALAGPQRSEQEGSQVSVGSSQATVLSSPWHNWNLNLPSSWKGICLLQLNSKGMIL